MTSQNQPPPKAVANLPISTTVVGAFASVGGQLNLVARAAKGGFLLLVVASLISLAVPGGGNISFFLVMTSFAATSHFGVNWCRVMLLGPQALPARSLTWGTPHWRFFGYSLLLFLIMMVVTLPLTVIGSVLGTALGLVQPGQAGSGLGFIFTLVFLGMLYVLARLGFILPAVAVEESYSLKLAWQHTAGQGARLTAALFTAGLPIVVAQLIVTAFLLQSLLGISVMELLPPLPTPGEAPVASELVPSEIEAPPILGVILFDLIAAAINFLSFGVLFSLLCLAFRRCTGWVPAGPGNLPTAQDNDPDAPGNDA